MYAVIGGLHLTGRLFESRIPATVAALQAIMPRYVLPGHCTGRLATHQIAGALPDAFTANSVGTTSSSQRMARREPEDLFLWGPGTCTGQVLVLVGFSLKDVQGASALFAQITLAAIDRCPYCVDFERTVPIYVRPDECDLPAAVAVAQALRVSATE